MEENEDDLVEIFIKEDIISIAKDFVESITYLIVDTDTYSRDDLFPEIVNQMLLRFEGEKVDLQIAAKILLDVILALKFKEEVS